MGSTGRLSSLNAHRERTVHEASHRRVGRRAHPEPGPARAGRGGDLGVNTRITRRDDDLRSDNFFSAEKFPNLVFRAKRVQNVRAGGFDLVGDLTIRDVTHEVVLKVEGPTAPIRDPQGKRRVGASASTTINRKDFGIAWHRAIETGGVVVGDEVKINIDIEAVEKKS